MWMGWKSAINATPRTTIAKLELQTNRKWAARIEVRRDSVKALLNGALWPEVQSYAGTKIEAMAAGRMRRYAHSGPSEAEFKTPFHESSD